MKAETAAQAIQNIFPSCVCVPTHRIQTTRVSVFRAPLLPPCFNASC